MSKAEILAKLPELTAEERGELFEQLWRLEEAAHVSEHEKSLLKEAQANYDANPSAGSSWSEVEARLRRRS